MGLFGVLFAATSLFALQALTPAIAGAHSRLAELDGRIPGQADFKRVGKTTYRFLPERKEYEISRPGKPASFIHADYVPALAGSMGGGADLPTQESQPICRTGGSRVVVVYTHRPSDNVTVPVATLRGIVRRMNWKIENQASQTNPARQIKMAVDCSVGGEIEIYSVATKTSSDLEIFEKVPLRLFGSPTGADALKYLMFDQGGSSTYAGLGDIRDDSQKTRSNLNATTTNGALIVNGYWDTHVAIHELFHSLGATQGWASSPPFASKGSHCTDGIDVMCYNDEAPGDNGYTETRCPASAGYNTSVGVPIDCGDDTYFNGAPRPGSWLASNWDLAGVENPFLVTQPTNAPKATTGGTSSIKASSAVLEGAVTPEADYAFHRFDYGPTLSYGQSTQKKGVLGSGSISAAVSVRVEGLKPNTTYHYRAVGLNDAGTAAFGSDKTFKTAVGPGVLVEGADIAGGSAVLRGSVNPGGSNTTYQFEWGKTTAYGNSVPVTPKSVGSGTDYLSVSEAISVKGEATYHFRLKASNGNGVEVSPDSSFTTPDWYPNAVTTKPTINSAYSNKAVFRGIVDPNGLPTTYQFEYEGILDTTDKGTVPAVPMSAGAGDKEVAVSVTVSDLVPGGDYVYRLAAVNSEGTSVGKDWAFNLPNPTLVVETKPATDVLSARATLHGDVHTKGRATNYTFLYGPTSEYGSESEVGLLGEGNGMVEVSKTITGLKPGTTYHFQLVGLNEDGLVFGEDKTFTTAATAHRPRINAASYPATVNASQEATSKLKLGFGALSAECATMTATSGSLAAASHEVLLLASFGSCNAFGFTTATIAMNSCRFVLHAKNDGPPYAGSLEVACAKAGDGIVIAAGTCEAKIGPQEGIGGIGLANLGSGSSAEVKLSASSTGIAYAVAKDGIGCPFSAVGNYANGSAAGALKLSGTNGASQVGVFVSGEEVDLNGFYMAGEKSTEEAKQPRFEAESYPASVKGAQEAANKLKLGFGALSAECATLSTTSGSLAKATRELPLFASFGGGCTNFGFTTATIAMNSCRFVLRALNEGPPYAGTLEVACTTSGDGIVIAGGTCEVKLAAQKGIGGIGLATLGKGDEREVRLSAASTAIPYTVTKDGVGCPLPGVGSYVNGSLSGALRISG